MRISIKQDSSCEDLDIKLRYRQKDELVSRIISFLSTVDKQISCYQENEEYLVNVSDIYYIESVDKRTYVYLISEVYQTSYRLYQLIHELQDHGFVQISKACLVNINKLKSVRPLFNSRMEATLENGEKLIINRSYLQAVKAALKGGEQ